MNGTTCQQHEVEVAAVLLCDAGSCLSEHVTRLPVWARGGGGARVSCDLPEQSGQKVI